jgi:hypothetical protein
VKDGTASPTRFRDSEVANSKASFLELLGQLTGERDTSLFHDYRV